MNRRTFSTSVSMMFREFAPEARFSEAARAGFAGAEIQMLGEAAPDALARAARAAGVEIVLINVPMGDFLSGGAGLSGAPGREAAFRDAFLQALDAAGHLAPRFIHIGPSRLAGAEREPCLDAYRRNLDMALTEADKRDVRAQLVIEAINRADFPDALFASTAEVAALIEAHYKGAVGILFDLYHVARNGEHPARLYADHAGLVSHIQFSDVPGRTPPGEGALDFASLFAEIEAAGYAGWYGAEYMPSRPTLETLGWLPRLAERG